VERPHYFRSTDGTRLAWFEKGTGSPIVVLAGGYALSHGYLRPIADGLAATHRVILPDQRGTGRSGGDGYNNGSVTIDTLVTHLEALRKRLRLGRLNLLGTHGAVCRRWRTPLDTRVESRAWRRAAPGAWTLPLFHYMRRGEEARLKAVLTKDELRRLESLMTGEYPMSEKTRSEISHLRAAASFYDRKRAEEWARYFDTDPFNEPAASTLLTDPRNRNWTVRSALQTLRAPVLIIHCKRGSHPSEHPELRSEAPASDPLRTTDF